MYQCAFDKLYGNFVQLVNALWFIPRRKRNQLISSFNDIYQLGVMTGKNQNARETLKNIKEQSDVK